MIMGMDLISYSDNQISSLALTMIILMHFFSSVTSASLATSIDKDFNGLNFKSDSSNQGIDYKANTDENDYPKMTFSKYDSSFPLALYSDINELAKRMGSEFLGKRMGSEFLGKRMGSEFLGKRLGSEFLGKRLGSEFLGKRMDSKFLGK